MNGKSYFLDTNAIIQLLKGNPELLDILREAEYIACSIISKLEYLSFSNLSENDIRLFNAFSERIEIMPLVLNEDLEQHILNFRKDEKLKLPDAIIVGSSAYKECILITADNEILKKVEQRVLSYEII